MGRWWRAGALTGALIAVTALLPAFAGLDTWARNECDAHRPLWAYEIVVNVNRLGSGGSLTAIALVISVILAPRRRSWKPVLLVVTAFVAVVVMTEPFKWLMDRPAPHALAGGGVSYPSGHAVNAIVWYAVLCTLIALPPRLRALIRWAPPVILFATNVYLGFHWISDMIAGVLLGLLIETVLRGTELLGLPGTGPLGTGPLGTGLQTRRTSTPAARSGASVASVASESVTSV
jgi:hypothetical protein